MKEEINKTNEENITNMTLYLYLNRYSGLVVEKATVEAKIGYNTVKYKRMKKEYKNDIKRIKSIDELPQKWSKYFEEAEEEMIRDKEKSYRNTHKKEKKFV